MGLGARDLTLRRRGISVYEASFQIESFDHVPPAAQCRLVEALVGALAGANVAFLLANGNVPALYDSGVSYSDPPTTPGQPWRDIPRILKSGHGTCMELAAWRIAELAARHSVSASPHVTQTPDRGRMLYHVQVCFDSTGQVEDPSTLLGMGGSAWSHFG